MNVIAIALSAITARSKKIGEHVCKQARTCSFFLRDFMNIQIFGKAKCFDTKKAERYFKERRIKYQSVDLLRYSMSNGEYSSVKKAIGGMDALIDKESKAYKELYIEYKRPEDVEAEILEHPELFKTPIVRNGKQATVGYAPEVWKTWE